jgi:hypothetical protein
MQRSLCRIDVARGWELARCQYAAVINERDRLRQELEMTKQSLAEVRDAMAELRAAVLARQYAEAELASLYRERAIQRARAAKPCLCTESFNAF